MATGEELPPELPGVVELGDEVLVEFAADVTERFLLVDPVEAPAGRYRCRILATHRFLPSPAEDGGTA